MINTKKLRGKIIEQGLTYAVLADLMGISSCTFGKKIRNVSDMYISEAEQLVNILHIPKNDMMSYFFMEETDE